MFVKILFILSLIASGLFCVDLKASDQRYIITEAVGRAFMLDTETGETWRYYFNEIDDQGWLRVLIKAGRDEKNEYFRSYPCGERLSIPVSKPVKPIK